MLKNIFDSVSVVKLVTGETLIGLCVQVTEQFIHFAFPYDISEDIKIYNMISKNRMYTFDHKDIVYFKEAKEEFKMVFQEILKESESNELAVFLDNFSDPVIPEGCFFIQGNSTLQ